MLTVLAHPPKLPVIQTTTPINSATQQPGCTDLVVTTTSRVLDLARPQQTTALVRATRFMGEHKKPLIIGATSLSAAFAAGFGAEALINAGILTSTAAHLAGLAVTGVVGGATTALLYGGKHIARAYQATRGTVLANRFLETHKPTQEQAKQLQEAHHNAMPYVCERITERIFTTDPEDPYKLADELNKLTLFNGYGVHVLKEIVVKALSEEIARPDIAQKALLALIKIDSEESRDVLAFLRTAAELDISLDRDKMKFELFLGAVRVHREFTPEQMATIIHWGGLGHTLQLREDEIVALWPHLTDQAKANVEQALSEACGKLIMARNMQGMGGISNTVLKDNIKTYLLFLQKQFGQDLFRSVSHYIYVRDAAQRVGVLRYAEALSELNPERAINVFTQVLRDRKITPHQAGLQSDRLVGALALFIQNAQIALILAGRGAVKDKVDQLIDLWALNLGSAPFMEAIEQQIQGLRREEYGLIVCSLHDKIRRNPHASKTTKLFVYRLLGQMPCRESLSIFHDTIRLCLEHHLVDDAKNLLGYLAKIGDQTSLDFIRHTAVPLAAAHGNPDSRKVLIGCCNHLVRAISSRLIEQAF
ncbi:MAG: hypothetical protein ABII18_07990 [bacterium]